MATIEERVYEANRAKEVLENPAFIQAFEDIRKELIETWENTPARDTQGRESIWAYLTLLKKVQTHLKTSLETGRLAVLEVEHKKTLAERLGMTSWTL